jgi:hypothetical protein
MERLRWRRANERASNSTETPGDEGDQRRHIAHNAALIRMALQAALWGAVALGVLGGLVAVVRHGASPSLQVVAPIEGSPASGRVDGFAELFVAVYLNAGSGSEASLAPFFAGSVDLSQVSAGSEYVARTAVANSTRVAPDYWSVTVAAEVLEQRGGQYSAGALRYFEVGVFVDGHGNPVATAAPAEVSAPPRGTAPSLALQDLAPPDPSDPLQATAHQFLEALLCGQGDISRVESPGVSIPAIQPTPLTRVDLTAVAEATSGASRRLTALVSGSTSAGNNVVLEYQLVLRQRAGRWEVAAMSGAPALANPSSGRATQPSTSGASTARDQSLAPAVPPLRRSVSPRSPLAGRMAGDL